MPRLKQQPKPAALAGKIPVLAESEKAVIGAALRSSSVAELVATELPLEAFHNPLCQQAYAAIKGLLEDNLTVTPVSVAERAGLKLVAVQPLVDESHKGDPGTLVKELARVAELRKIWQSCQDFCSTVGVDSKPEEVVGLIESALYGKDSHSNDAQDGSAVLERVRNDFIKKSLAGGGPEVSTGLASLDKAIISLSGPKVIVVAARPSMGKTACSGTLRRAVLRQGLGVMEFNLEMSAEEIAERELAFQAKLNLRKVLSGKNVSPEEQEAVGRVDGSQFSGMWFIDDRTSSIVGVRRKARLVAGRLSRAGKRIGLVILDYLQLAGDNGEGREQSIAAISRGCKLLAKELGCPVLVLSQLNRSCEYREDRRPLLSDLRESGAIEQDADTVIFIYRGHLYDELIPPEETELIIRKQRSGPIGTVRVRYNPGLVTFEDLPA